MRCFSPAAEKSCFHILVAHGMLTCVQKFFKPQCVCGKSISYRIPRVYFIYWRRRDIISTLAKISARRAHTERDEFLCLAQTTSACYTVISLVGKWHWMYVYKSGISARQPNGISSSFYVIVGIKAAAPASKIISDPHSKFFAARPLKVIKPWEFFDVNFQFDIISHQRRRFPLTCPARFFPSARREWWTRVLFALQLFTLPSSSSSRPRCCCVSVWLPLQSSLDWDIVNSPAPSLFAQIQLLIKAIHERLST